MTKRIDEQHNYRLYWHDDEQTILVGEITDRWTWEESAAFTERINATMASQSHGVYMVYYFSAPISAMMPKGAAFPNLQHSLKAEVDNEIMNILVGGKAMKPLQHLVNMVTRTFNIQRKTPVYFVATLDEALAIIANHK